MGIDVDLKVQPVDIKDIKVAEYNAKDLTVDEKELLQKSLERFGLVQPLIVNRRTGILISGHQRLKVLIAKGAKKVPVAYVDLPVEEEKALNLTLNNPHVGGHFEFELLENSLKELENALPDAFDQLGMFKLKGGMGAGDVLSKEDLEGKSPVSDKDEGINSSGMGEHPDMELQPYESYDYIVVLFKDSRDFEYAAKRLGIKNVNFSNTSRKRIGIGRCIDGIRLMALLENVDGG